ncbi:MAG: hypothetical protein AB8H80_12730 [Planctomycetota bacterium]
MRPQPLQAFVAAVLLLAALAPARLTAQCASVVQPGFAHQGAFGNVTTTCFWNRAGLASPLVFFGGDFTLIERTPCSGAAIYNPASREWQALPAGVFDTVHAAIDDGANSLVLAGSLGSGPLIQHRVARWDGSSWSVLGSEFDDEVLALNLRSSGSGSGELVAGGSFTANGGQAAAGVARWDGASWVALGAGVRGGATPTSVQTMCELSTGELIVGGTFALAGTSNAANVASWDGSQWQALGAGLPNSIRSLAALTTGELFAAATVAADIQQWNGSSWQVLPGLGAPLGSPAPRIAALAAGGGSTCGLDSLVIVGDFDFNGQRTSIASWSQICSFNFFSGFDGLPTSNGPLAMALAVDPSPQPSSLSNLAIAGPFDGLAGTSAPGLALIRSFFVESISDGINGAVRASAELPDGDVLLGGSFGSIDRAAVFGLARGNSDGSLWRAPQLAGSAAISFAFLAPEVRAIQPTDSGALLVAGSFTLAGAPGPNNQASSDVARFDGSNWTGYGPTPFLGGAHAALEHSDGTLYAGGNGLYRRDPAGWTLLTTVSNGLGGTILSLTELPNGDLVAAGSLQNIPGPNRPGVMRWDGATWQFLGAGLASVLPGSNRIVTACRARDDGVLFACGAVDGAPFVARFDGTNWQVLPAPSATSPSSPGQAELFALELLPNGDAVVGGRFDAIGGISAASVARWNGSSWSPVGDGVTNFDGAPGTVYGLSFSRSGALQISGMFDLHDQQISSNFARRQGSCPATALSFGGGCLGSGGTPSLRADRLAWLGGSMASSCEFLPDTPLALNVVGITAAFAPLPLSPSNCSLWVTPDVVALLQPQGGRVETELAVPATSSLIGTGFYQQIVGVELDAVGTLTGLVGSNRLQLTIGTF